MTKHFCDHCGKIVKWDDRIGVDFYTESSIYSYSYFNICKDCKKELTDYLKQFLKKDES